MKRSKPTLTPECPQVIPATPTNGKPVPHLKDERGSSGEEPKQNGLVSLLADGRGAIPRLMKEFRCSAKVAMLILIEDVTRQAQNDVNAKIEKHSTKKTPIVGEPISPSSARWHDEPPPNDRISRARRDWVAEAPQCAHMQRMWVVKAAEQFRMCASTAIWVARAGTTKKMSLPRWKKLALDYPEVTPTKWESMTRAHRLRTGDKSNMLCVFACSCGVTGRREERHTEACLGWVWSDAQSSPTFSSH